jgi:hypothetical protein
MSHFTVLVIGENPEAQLAPFQENNMGDCPSQYMEFTDNEDENRREYEEGTTTKVIMPDGRKLNSWDDEFRVNDSIGHGSGTHKVPDHLEKREIKFTEIYKTFEEYMSDWHGTKKRDEKTGRYGYWENPNAKWDWYSLGGRWAGFFILKSEQLDLTPEPMRAGGKLSRYSTKEIEDHNAKLTKSDQAYKKDIDFEKMRNDAAELAAANWEIANKVIGHLPVATTWAEILKIEGIGIEEKRARYHAQPRAKAWSEAERKNRDSWPFGYSTGFDDLSITKDEYVKDARDSAISTHAVIIDGKWYERGSMGWWAIVSDEKDNWDAEFSKLLDSATEDALLSVYDCHI